MERKDNVVAVKVTYSKMKNLSVFLVNKLILVARVSKMADMEKAVDGLNDDYSKRGSLGP